MKLTEATNGMKPSQSIESKDKGQQLFQQTPTFRDKQNTQKSLKNVPSSNSLAKTTTRTRKAIKEGRCDAKPPAPLFGEAAAESEMVTLERIENQKKSLLKSCYFKKATTTLEGIQVKAQTLLLRNVSFGLRSRFLALLGLIEGSLAGKVKHFSIFESQITSQKLQQILALLQHHCQESLQSVTLVDLAHPLKKATVAELCLLLSACCDHDKGTTSQAALVIERCTLSHKRVIQLSTGLPSQLRILNLRNMSLVDDAFF